MLQWELKGPHPFWLQTLYKAGKMSMSSIKCVGGRPLPVHRGLRCGMCLTGQTHGQSLRNEVCIRVEWKFLSFLAVLIGLELLFAATSHCSQPPRPLGRRGTGNLPHLASSCRILDGPSQRAREGGGPWSAAAEPMNVSLSRVEGRWQLTREGKGIRNLQIACFFHAVAGGCESNDRKESGSAAD